MAHVNVKITWKDMQLIAYHVQHVNAGCRSKKPIILHLKALEDCIMDPCWIYKKKKSCLGLKEK